MNQDEMFKGRVQIGLTGWGDHDDIYHKGINSSQKLHAYSNQLPLVELDSSFYGIPSPERMLNWCLQTPESFGFIVKAYQGMTGHTRGDIPYPDSKTMFMRFRESVEVMQQQNKLKAVLFQYPPWFDCQHKHVEILRRTKQWMNGLPLALEFRHQSWFRGDMRERTLSFMREEEWIHTICDEPQAGEGSVPTVLVPTRDDVTIVRMHGRHTAGWHASGQPNWREIRYLYRYNEQELLEWREHLRTLLLSTKACWVVFNNNSGGDAAMNARQLMMLLGMEPPRLPPAQLSLFEGDHLD